MVGQAPTPATSSAPTAEEHQLGHNTNYYDPLEDGKSKARYYALVEDSFSTSDGERLYQALHQLLSENPRDLGYKKARQELYRTVDRRPDGNLYYLYSGEGPKFSSEVELASSLTELANYNCEHIVPQSWFAKRQPMVSDLHHLFTEEVKCNARRGNLELTEVEHGSQSIAKCGEVLPGRAFEPLAGKGEAARATLYFLTRYPQAIGGKNQTSLDDVRVFLRWHEQFPVSEYERHRNARIHELQGNRNPYIDHPELAAKVDFRPAFRGAR